MLEELEADDKDLLATFILAIHGGGIEYEPMPFKNEVEALLAKYGYEA